MDPKQRINNDIGMMKRKQRIAEEDIKLSDFTNLKKSFKSLRNAAVKLSISKEKDGYMHLNESFENHCLLTCQAESGAWRNAYLMASKELREGNAVKKYGMQAITGAIMSNMTPENVFDYLAIQLDKNAVSGKKFKINFVFKDTGKKRMLYFDHGAVLQYADYNDPSAELTITTGSKAILYRIRGQFEELSKAAKFDGDVSLLKLVMSNLTQGGNADFNIVEP